MLRSLAKVSLGIASVASGIILYNRGNTYADEAEEKLEKLIVVSRHGARTFLSSEPHHKYTSLKWACEDIEDDNLVLRDEEHGIQPYNSFKKILHTYGKPKLFGDSCVTGEMTTFGTSQMENFGKYLRSRYIDDLHFLDPEYNTDEEVWIRSTRTSRTILTARAIIKGLYPENTRKEGAFVPINVIVDETLYPRSSCENYMSTYRKSKDKWKSDNSSEYEQYNKVFSSISDPDEVKYWLRRGIAGRVNELNSLHVHGFPLPEGITEENLSTYQKLSGDLYQETFGDNQGSRLGIGRFLEELKNVIENTSGKTKLWLFSGHDNTLAPLLVALEGLEKSGAIHPPMGSALVIEIWKNSKTSKRSYKAIFWDSQKAIPINPSPNENGLSDIKIIMNQIKDKVPTDYTNECGIKPKQIKVTNE